MDDLCSELEQRFQLAKLVVASACDLGHVHDGRSCGLDIVAGDALVPGSSAEFVVELDARGCSSEISRAWASGDSPTLVARVAAAYVSLEGDPRLARALDEVDAKHLCGDCPEPCTLEEGVHSTGRAVLMMSCGTQEREIASQLMRRWRGTGGQLLAVALAAAR